MLNAIMIDDETYAFPVGYLQALGTSPGPAPLPSPVPTTPTAQKIYPDLQ